MDKLEVLHEFMDNRPDSVGVYGYGSGVFRQHSYSSIDKPQIDMIFIVDNIKDWHLENMEKNKKDYSLTGKLHLKYSSVKRIKSYNKITYFSQINENGYRFKYGVIEVDDFIHNLHSWENIFVAGRFQKPVLELKTNQEIKDAIDVNRRKAFYISILLSKSVTNQYKLLNLLCSLSYIGALRMKVAENPNKVENIVKGSFRDLVEIYNYSEDYIVRDGYNITIDHEMAIERLMDVPECLLEYLISCNIDFDNLYEIRKALYSFFIKHNRKEELRESFAGLATNGIIRSTPYVVAKVKKRIGK